jgi:hypothetical protein
MALPLGRLEANIMGACVMRINTSLVAGIVAFSLAPVGACLAQDANTARPAEQCENLLALYKKTFLAEDGKPVDGKTWRDFLLATLSNDFTLRRSDNRRKNERREEMIRDIESAQLESRSASTTRRIMDEDARAWCTDTLGVVFGPIKVVGDGKVTPYQNIKVFSRATNKDEWLCIYWQVTGMPTKDQ